MAPVPSSPRRTPLTPEFTAAGGLLRTAAALIAEAGTQLPALAAVTDDDALGLAADLLGHIRAQLAMVITVVDRARAEGRPVLLAEVA